MKKSFTVLIALFFVTIMSFGQKLKSGNWEVAIEKWAKSEKGMFGETLTIYEGVVSIKRGKTKLKSHLFQYTESNGKLVVKDLKKKVIIPQLTYLDSEKSFLYTNSKGEELKKNAVDVTKNKNIVLSGIIVWLDYKE